MKKYFQFNEYDVKEFVTINGVDLIQITTGSLILDNNVDLSSNIAEITYKEFKTLKPYIIRDRLQVGIDLAKLTRHQAEDIEKYLYNNNRLSAEMIGCLSQYAKD